MSIINLIQISHDYGNKLLFDNISLSLDNQTKAGLIGKNGTGKSTLFKIITGQLAPYKGQVHIAKDYKIGFFAQDYSFSSKDTLWNWIYNSKTDLIIKKKELAQVEKELVHNHNEKLLQKLDNLQVEYELLGGFSYENEIKSLLLTFGFTEKDYKRIIDDFSGGEKTRIRLISILLNKFDFILFDEPTNHLDLVTVDWFIQYLKNLDCGYLIVSHDRYLLDQTVNKIYELTNQRIDSYTGNYTSYLQQSKDREILLQKQFTQQQKLIEKTVDFIRRNMAGQKVNQAKSRLKMLNRMERIDLDNKDKNISLNIDSSHRSGNDIFRMKNLKIGYDNCVLADNINLNLHYQDKICLVGANGSGKTTLLKILNNECLPLDGDLWTGYNLSVGYYDQLHIDLDPNFTVLETIWNLVPGETFGYVMTYLAKFGFYENIIDQKVSSLSGGEKSRLFIAQLIHEKPNLLILDEPTNHLDISMIQSLEMALKNYDGTLILVSHDRYFIQSITDNYWIIKDNTITQYNDSFDNILEKISPFEKKQKIENSIINESNTKSKKNKKPNEYILNKIITQIENYDKKIKDSENEISRIQNQFSDSTFYSKQENIVTANSQIEALKKDINIFLEKKDELETEYLLMSEL